MTMTTQCPRCKHYIGMGICKAYNNGIPKQILLGEHDHRQPYSGDGGIRFTPIDAQDAPPQELV